MPSGTRVRPARAPLVAATLAALALLAAAAATAAGGAPLPRVTVIGDSVADALGGDTDSIAILSQGIDLDLELAACRRVGQDSCPYNGVRPPNVLELVQSLGPRIGSTVVVAVGYNDFEQDYAADIEAALSELEAAHVRHVLWLTLRAVQHQYLTMNDDILAAAARHPELAVVDWNLYSRSHPDWFQADGLHLTGAGSQAMATLLHQTLVGLGIAGAPAAPAPANPVRVATARLPDAVRGRPYAARLRAAAGRAPYFWSFPNRPPRGLHLRPTGWIFGTPAAVGSYRLAVRVADGAGGSATATLHLVVRRR